MNKIQHVGVVLCLFHRFFRLPFHRRLFIAGMVLWVALGIRGPAAGAQVIDTQAIRWFGLGDGPDALA